MINIENLSWYKPHEVQNEAINNIIDMVDLDLSILVMPQDKSCWENSALAIKEIGFPRIEAILPNLFEWLQDMNWPGAWIILDVLKGISKSVLLEPIESATAIAIMQNNELWLEALKMIIEYHGILETDFKQKTLYNVYKD